MNRPVLALIAALLAACTSPESTRTRGGGPGADTGNRGAVVLMHEGAKPYQNTPRLIPVQSPSLDGAQQAHELSR
jgi:hypothetical protein